MELSLQQKKLAGKIINNRTFAFFLMVKLPMGWLAGLRVDTLNNQECITTIPFKRLNKNPFQSIYFAVQSMAAELSTASACLLAIEGKKPTVAFIIVDMKATFHKKATNRVFFTCNENQKAFTAVEECIKTGESSQATFKSIGKMGNGTVVSEFEFTWSFKQRKS
ncbi:MAG: DUF4442 domain-containing protein [Bacteroidota bacterium]